MWYYTTHPSSAAMAPPLLLAGQACAIMLPGTGDGGIRLATKNRPRKRRALLIASVCLLSVFVGAMAGALAAYLRSAPDLDEVAFDPNLTTYLYDVNGELLARFYTENRIPVKLRDIPLIVQQAFIAAEDGDFYNHHGIDFSGIARAAIANLTPGGRLQGGSTITQQLAKLAFLTNERTWSRKLRELLWAIQIERKYTKEEILEAYLNIVYFGHGTYGVEAAAQLFLGKPISEVNSPEEAALLAGIVNGPGFYSPYYDIEASRDRRNLVLRRMYEMGFISEREYNLGRQRPVEVVESRRQQSKAPHFVEYVRRLLLERYGSEMLYKGGLRVYTTLDLNMQRMAEEAVREWVPAQETDDQGLTQPQVALVAIDAHYGFIRAMVGGRENDHFNRAVQARRQPGSAMKPFVYAAAIDSKRYTAADVFADEPTEFHLVTGEVWAPQNYDQTFAGPITLREALEQSSNVVAAKLINQITPRTAVDYAKRLGITTLVESGRRNDVTLAFALGGLTNGVTPLEMVRAYAVFANGGILVEPIAILRVERADGTVLEEFRPQRRLVLSPETAYIITDMLRGVVERGTGIGANLGRPAAGKTGTTSDFTDAWFVGYTPSLVAAVWIGNDSNKPMVYPNLRIGSALASRTWRGFMERVLRGTEIEDFARPSGIVGPLLIDKETGGLVTDSCRSVPSEDRVYEIFIEGTEPKEVSERCSSLFTPPPGFFRWPTF